MRRPLRLAALLLLLAACVGTPDVELSAAPEGAYRLDPDHAFVTWRVSHMNGLSRIVGRFERIEAAVDFVPENLAASRVEATIDAMSASTGIARLDEMIRVESALLDADRFPEIRFVSTAIAQTGPATADVTGDLTFRGVTLPVTLATVFNGALTDPLRFSDVIGFSASAVIDRAAFGADGYAGFGVGTEVEVLIEVELLRAGG